MRVIIFSLLFLSATLLLPSCAMPESPEAKSREMNEEARENKRSTDFAHNALPPVQNAETPERY